jgi:membrane protein DedA with SNARE-associated domain
VSATDDGDAAPDPSLPPHPATNTPNAIANDHVILQPHCCPPTIENVATPAAWPQTTAAGSVRRMTSTTEPADATIDEHQPSPKQRQAILITAGVLFATGIFGTNVGPAWVDERTSLVLALSSRNRNLLGAVPYLDVIPWAAIGFVRTLLVGVVLYFLGKWYGATALRWTEGQLGEVPRIYLWFQRAIDKAAWLMLILMPGSNLVCMMAGHRRMRLRSFLVCIVTGIVIKLVVLRVGGDQFKEEITDFLTWLNQYQWWVVGGLFAITFLQSANKARKSMPEVIREIETPDGIIDGRDAITGEPVDPVEPGSDRT